MAAKKKPKTKTRSSESLAKVEGYRRGTEGAPRGPSPFAGNTPVKRKAERTAQKAKLKKFASKKKSGK